MKKFKIILIIIFLLITLAYVTNINAIPKHIILFKNEKLDLGTILGIYIIEEEQGNYKTIQASSQLQNIETIESKKISLNLFNIFNVKDIEVSIIPKTEVVPLSNAIGLKLYTNGVLVVGMSEIQGKKPYENSGIKEGDVIISINNNIVTNTNELVKVVNNSNGKKINIKYIRNSIEYSAEMEPTKTVSNEYKLGLWVRDGAAGIGTITYYEPSTGMFAALGHGILDIDTDQLIDIASGEIVTTSVISITKGKNGIPGEIKGTIANGKTLGAVYKNTSFGIYGKLTNTSLLNFSEANKMEVALREEIKEGPAKIVCTLEGNVRKEYEIEIKRIYKNNNYNNKSMQIEIKDEELLNLTGGIIQGMSGSPIIQNKKFIGAVTHVLVSDPTQGYAVFGDLMIKEMREVK